jgi:nicotinamide mononucleotide transporter
MEILTYMFSLNETLFSIGTYAVSPLEAWATITGLASVILARKNLVSNFYIGLINCVGFGALFFQIQLYSDMLLQLYFISMSLWGIHVWSKKDVANDNVVNVRWMRGNEWQMVLMIITQLLILNPK